MSFCRVTRAKCLPTTQAEAPEQCEGFMRCLFFRRTWSSKLKKSTSQGLLDFPWKLSSLQGFFFFFSIWACTCTTLVDIPGGLVVSDSSLGITSGSSIRPGGTCHGCPRCHCVCASVHQHPRVRAALLGLLAQLAMLPQRRGPWQGALHLSRRGGHRYPDSHTS